MLNRIRVTLGRRSGLQQEANAGLENERKQRSDALNCEQVDTIRTFYERDDNSRLMPGKRDTVTLKKLKKQKRLLSDRMAILHAKFRYEHSEIDVGYTTFCRHRPFWVVVPKLENRDTCMCKRRSNVELMAKKLHQEGIIPSTRPSDQYDHLVCDRHNKECMYGTCDKCEGKRLPHAPEANNQEIGYDQRVTREKESVKTSGDEESTKRV